MSNEASQLAGRIFKRIWGTLVLRPLQRWNAENRAIKIVEKSEKQGMPVVKPPPLNATKEYLEKLLKAHPEIVGEVTNPNTSMVERSNQLKVHVEKISAVDNVQSDVPAKSSRPLPVLTRKLSIGFDQEPDIVPAGKVTVSMATDIIRGHFAHPEDYPLDGLAEHYGVEEKDVENLVEYYKPFHFIHPEDKTLPATDVEWMQKNYFSDIYYLKKAHETLDNRERALAEGKTFADDINASSMLLRTPAYTEENAKWLQDEDERWGRKKSKKLPAPRKRVLINESKENAKLEAQPQESTSASREEVDTRSREDKTKSSKVDS